MAKKRKSTKIIKEKYEPWTKVGYLEYLIQASERAITGQGGSIDELFQNQANAYREKLKALRSKK